jgi:hypothetical protein
MFNPRRFLAACATTGMLFGCNGTRVTTVAALSEGSLVVTRTQGSSQSDLPSGYLDLPPSKDGSECPVLAGDVRVTVNGQPAVVSPGGAGRPGLTGPLELSTPCLPPSFVPGAPLRATDALAVHIEDAAGAIDMTVAEMMLPRALAFVTPGDGVVRRGEAAQLGWSPASDALDDSSWHLTYVPRDGVGVTVDDPRFAPGGALTFRVAPDTPPGSGALRLAGDSLPQIGVCSGVAHCRADVSVIELDVPMTVAP